MALFVIEAVRLSPGGDRVEYVRWGKVKGGEVSPPVLDHTDVVGIGQVVEALRAGDEVQTIFTDESGPSFGPNVEIVEDEQGAVSITTAAGEVPNRSFLELPRF